MALVSNFLLLAFVSGSVSVLVSAKTIDIEKDLFAIPDDDSFEVGQQNTDIINFGFQKLEKGDKLLIPGGKTFYVNGGITATKLHSVTIQLEGTLSYLQDIKRWPRTSGGKILPCFDMIDSENVNVTSSQRGKGIINGNGQVWWGIPFIGYLVRTENRPRLFEVHNGKNLVIENITLLDSPYWTTFLKGDGITIRYCDIIARRTRLPKHDLIDLSAFNTDGFDVSGKNFHIHDSTIWSQDDSIAVKGSSENMLFERINCSGLGLVIGSIGEGTVVKNITFRDSLLKNTLKGIYMKFAEVRQPVDAIMQDILYENIIIDEPEQWPIWIGPAQQSDHRNPCQGFCSLCWPMVPGYHCKAAQYGLYQNITLRNIRINQPKTSAGVLLGSELMKMKNVVFDGVKVDVCRTSGLSIDESFPFLKRVHDPFVYKFFSLVLTIATCLIVPIYSCIISGCCSWCWKRAYFRIQFSLVMVLLGLFLLYELDINSQMKKQDHYFRCEGIENGVAIGDTWPIPSCFADKTSSQDPHPGRCENWVDEVFLYLSSCANFLSLLLVTSLLFLSIKILIMSLKDGVFGSETPKKLLEQEADNENNMWTMSYIELPGDEI